MSDLVFEAQPCGPHGRLERPAPQEGVLGLAGFVLVVFMAGNAVGTTNDLRRRPVLG